MPIPTFRLEGLGVTNFAFTNISSQGAQPQLQCHRLCLLQHFSSMGLESILVSPTFPLLTFKLKGLTVTFGVIEFTYANILARGAHCHQLFHEHFGSWSHHQLWSHRLCICQHFRSRDSPTILVSLILPSPAFSLEVLWHKFWHH